MSKRLTEKRLLNITLFYLSRYESSTEKVRAMLKRRLKRMKMQGEEIPDQADEWIENVLKTVQEKSYLSDSRYAENQVRSMVAQGKSAKYMCAKLVQAGIDPAEVSRLLEEFESTELERAKRFTQKKKIGFYRPKSERQKFYEKDMATLARAGFSYDVVYEILNTSE